MKPLVRGDYVLATKYTDGDPCDHFYVGFFREMLGDRFLVDDGKGQLARANGFRRCERISRRVGTALCAAMPIIGDVRGKSVWWWRRHVKAMEQLVSANKGSRGAASAYPDSAGCAPRSVSDAPESLKGNQ